jgi:hypothetical protein
MARRLHRYERHWFVLSIEPGTECGEPGPALAHPEDLPVGACLTIPTASHDVAPSTDVDPDRHHLGSLLPRPQGCPLTPVDVA